MQNTKVLEMVNKGQIEELKAMLQDEIYKESLNKNGNAKKRYMAMKRFFQYVDTVNKAYTLPCRDVKVFGEAYNSFVCGHAFALTKESVGEMECYDNSDNTYLNMEKFADTASAKSVEKINPNEILAKAKAFGYRYRKSETGVSPDFQYVFGYKDAYYKIGLLDQAFSIINDGKDAEVYYRNGKSILLIKTDVGIAGVLPFHHIGNMENKIIIEV